MHYPSPSSTSEAPGSAAALSLRVLVRRIERQCEDIHEFELVDTEGRELPAAEAGAHIEIDVPEVGPRHYSLCNDERERHRYVVGILRQDQGRGGSKAMHRHVRVGDVLGISAPRNHFRLDLTAQGYVLIGGGIGLTPILAMARSLARHGKRFDLHACTRSRAATPFVRELNQPWSSGTVHFVHDGGNPAAGLDVHALLAAPRPGVQVYCCGPGALMDAVAAATAHWMPGSVRFERFSPAVTPSAQAQGGEFSVKLRSTGQTIAVPTDRSLLDCLRAAGVPVESSCELGICGSCAVGVLSGTPLHRDDVLDAAEKASNQKMMACVSRAAQGDCLVLDL